jgi:hypothetical protein
MRVFFQGLHFLALVLLSGVAAAQSTDATAQSAQPQIEHTQQADSQHVFGVVPQFGVTNQINAAPLSPSDKFKLFLHSSFDPFVFAATGLQAGLSQATDEFPQYGQGASGYFKRFGASFADQASSNFFANYFYPVLLKEDPRYFRMGQGALKRRIVYALEQEFVAHKDSGGKTFAWENVLGAFTSGTLSNAYYPSKDRGVGLTISRSVIAILYGSVGGLFSEFSPDIQRKFFHRRQGKDDPSVAGPGGQDSH